MKSSEEDNPKQLEKFEKAISSAKLNTQITVRDAKDKKGCNIIGICLLPDNSLIMADWDNSSLKLVDPSWTLAGYLDMSDEPFDVCYTDNNQVAVTLFSARKVQFVSVRPTMQMTRSFKVGQCRGIAYSSGQLFVCSSTCADGCVFVYNLSGSLLNIIQLDQTGQSMFAFTWYITISSCGSKLHVTDKDNGMVTTDTADNLLATYTDTDMKSPRGICCLDTGDLLICDYYANCVHRVSGDGKNLGKLLTDKDGLEKPKAICYDPAQSRLFVSMEYSDNIMVYDLQ